MGEWKAQVSARIPVPMRGEMEQWAAAEHRTLGNLCSLLLEWSFEQLKATGSTEKLLHRKVPAPRNPDGNYRRSPETQKLLGE